MDLNKVMIIGRLTRDPEKRNIPSGDAVANFGVATNRVWTNNQGAKQEAVEYHNIVAWRKLAEICGQYLKKGDKVYIEGYLQTREWQGQDGIKRYRTEIVAHDLIMLSSLGGRQDNYSPNVATSQNTNSSNQSNNPTKPNEIPTINIDEELTTENPSQDSPLKPDAKKNPISTSPQNTDDEGISIEDIPF